MVSCLGGDGGRTPPPSVHGTDGPKRRAGVGEVANRKSPRHTDRGVEVADESFSCVVKTQRGWSNKIYKTELTKKDIIIKYCVSIGSIHREQG